MNNPTLSTAPTPSQITTLYRQNVANFLFCCDASLEQNQIPRDCDNITTWIGNTARSISLRAATSMADSDSKDITDHKSNKKKKKELTRISNTRNTKVNAHDVLRLQPSSNWSDNICMACGTLLFPPVMHHTAINTDINKQDKKEESSGSTNNNTRSDNQLQTPNQLLMSQPLPSNIYIRPLKRSRTRRRRASRVKAKELHNRALSIQRRGTSNTNIQLQKEILMNERIQQIASSYRLGDGRAKNCLVMKCTYCGTKKKRKGMEVKADIKRSSMGSDNNLLKPANNDTRTKIKGTAAQQPTNKEKKNVISQINDNSDYISLSSISGVTAKDNSQRNNTGKRKQNDDVSLLLSGKKKKKKKKAPEKKKSDLMDFLSSLND